MSDGTTIEWARHPETGLGASWNPLLVRRRDTGKVGYHCVHASEACRNCYAEAFNRRNLPERGTGLEFKPGHLKNLEVFVDDKTLMQPLAWKKPRGIFVCSMTDLFGDWVDLHSIDKLFAIMSMTPQHVYFILTKRPARAAQYTSGDTRMLPEHRIYHTVLRRMQQRLLIGSAARPSWPLPNVWMGTSVEDQATAEERIPQLLSAQAALHWISAEPLLGPMHLRRLRSPHDPDLYLDALSGAWLSERAVTSEDLSAHWSTNPPKPVAFPRRPRAGLRWVVAGGESGRGARPTHPDWIRKLRDDCGASAEFFFKQWGSILPEEIGPEDARSISFPPGHVIYHRLGKKKAGRKFEGVEHNGMPGRVDA